MVALQRKVFNCVAGFVHAVGQNALQEAPINQRHCRQTMISGYTQLPKRKYAVHQLHPLMYVKPSVTLVERVSRIFPLHICCGTLLLCGGLSMACSRLWDVGNISQQHCTLICGKVKDDRKRCNKTSRSDSLFCF